MDIECDKPCYFPGDTVKAIISIKSKKPIRGDYIKIEVIGKEKAIYQNFVDTEASKEHRSTFLNHKQKIYNIENGSMVPGEYELSIKFTLPEKELP